jgi:hypothetical protein
MAAIVMGATSTGSLGAFAGKKLHDRSKRDDRDVSPRPESQPLQARGETR